jgi:hypothetical protein
MGRVEVLSCDCSASELLAAEYIAIVSERGIYISNVNDFIFVYGVLKKIRFSRHYILIHKRKK